MATLYEISNIIDQLLESDYQAKEELENSDTGETDTMENILDKLEMDFKEKVDNIACYIKNLNADIEALKQEEKNLEERRKVKENKVESLKNYLSMNLLMAGYQKFETSRCALSFRKSKQIEISDNASIPEEYTTTKVSITPDKKALKEALESGEIIDGVSLVEKSNIQIK